MKNTGIWLDKNKALIVTIEDEKENLRTIVSNVEHYHVHGGFGIRHSGGSQDVVQDSKYLEREKHQLKRYFKKVISKIEEADALVIFGPGEIREKFQKMIYEDYKGLSHKLLACEKTDSMTDNQVKAWVRGFFKEKLVK